MNTLKELSRYNRIPLPNGTLLLVRREDSPYTIFQARIGYGHCHDQPKTDGTAHFAEHMFFQSNQKYTSAEIETQLQWLTGMIPNAMTDQEEIVTQCYAMPLGNLEQVMDIVASGLHNPSVKLEEFEMERLTILNELRTAGKFRKYLDEVVGKSLYPNHPYSSRFGRNVRAISRITPEQLDSIRNTYFNGPNLVIAIGGNITDHQIKVAGDLFGSRKAVIAPELPEVAPICEDVLYVDKFRDLEKPTLRLYRTFQLRPGREGIALDVLGMYFDSGIKSTLNHRLREDMRIAYGTDATLYSRSKVSLFITTAIGFEEQNIDTIMKVIEEEIERVKGGDVNTEYMELVKHMIALGYPRRFKTIEDRVGWMLDREVRNLPFDHQQYLDVVSSITAQDLTDVATKYLNGHKVTFAALN